MFFLSTGCFFLVYAIFLKQKQLNSPPYGLKLWESTVLRGKFMVLKYQHLATRKKMFTGGFKKYGPTKNSQKYDPKKRIYCRNWYPYRAAHSGGVPCESEVLQIYKRAHNPEIKAYEYSHG